ncbi:MAG: hypothetical protein JST39_17485, partial [Bacteroidetes bacterium]|nr:hypothetical protein [Bacteroidota bacterium]
TYKRYVNSGRWTLSDGKVILNPGKKQRLPVVSLTEKKTSDTGDITVRVHYYVQRYDDDSLRAPVPADFHLMTVYTNKRRHYRHLVHQHIYRICAFSPPVKRQIVLDSTDTYTLKREAVHCIGILTYGFDKRVELTPSDPHSDYFKITIVQPVHDNRAPQSKAVIVRRNKAFFHGSNEKPDTGFLSYPLKREI